MFDFKLSQSECDLLLECISSHLDQSINQSDIDRLEALKRTIESKSKPGGCFSVARLQMLALAMIGNQFDDLPTLLNTSGDCESPGSANRDLWWKDLGRYRCQWVVQEAYLDHLENQGLSDFFVQQAKKNCVFN